MNADDFKGSLPVTLIVLIALAGVCLLTQVKTLSSVEAFSFVTAVTTAVAVSGGGILKSPQSNAYLIPHLLIIIGVLAVTVLLGYWHYFTDTDVSGIFTGLFGGGLFGAGIAAAPSSATTVNTTTIVQHTSPAAPSADPSTFSTP